MKIWKVERIGDLRDLIQNSISYYKTIAIDTEYIQKHGHTSQLIAITLCQSNDETYYIDMRNPSCEVNTAINGLLAKQDLKKIFHNAKADIQSLHCAGFTEINNVYFDTMIAAWVTNSIQKRYGLKYLTKELFNYEMHDMKDWFKSGKTFLDYYNEHRKEAIQYACEDAYYTYKLYEHYKPIIDEKFKGVFYDIEMPVVAILAKMEMMGIRIDRERLKEFKDVYSGELETMEEALNRIGTPIVRSL